MVIADRFAADAEHKVVPANQVTPGWRILDLGPETVQHFRRVLADAQTILWNGSWVLQRMPAFAVATNALIAILGDRTQNGAITIIGGGDSAAAVDKARAQQTR